MAAQSAAVSSAPIVSVNNAVKTYGDRDAVAGVTFGIERPAIIGLVGPNGAGKTTLIKLLLGLTPLSGGRVQINGAEPAALYRPGGAAVGYMPQGEAIYPDLTARQNVAFFARLHGVPKARRQAALSRAFSTIDLSDRADDRVSTLSGGMRRRVSLACALVHQPRLLILDEPTVGVDPELRANMWGAFRALRSEGAIIFVSTHYLGEADRCDGVLLMRGGKIFAADTPRNLIRRTGTKDLEDAFLALQKEAK